MLHTVNKSPFERNALESCLAHVQDGSAVLLIEDGIYGALEGTSVTVKVKEAMKKIAIYALQPDVEARGMQSRVIEGIKLVDYNGFVDLVTQQNGVQSWL
jgi:tRNA 2-thiouridine synthesizing protein B